MSTFKEGDRVKTKFDTGTIVAKEYSGWYGVVHDTWTGGHDLGNTAPLEWGEIPKDVERRGYWVKDNGHYGLELLKNPTDRRNYG